MISTRLPRSGDVDYVPIDCSFHDRLESLAVQRMVVPIQVREADSTRTFEARIADVFSRDGAEFALLATPGGAEIEVRLDRLVSVAGLKPPEEG